MHQPQFFILSLLTAGWEIDRLSPAKLPYSMEVGWVRGWQKQSGKKFPAMNRWLYIAHPMRLSARFLVFTFATICAVASAAERPNILVIVADDLGYHDVGFQGSKDIPTPHLDALATGGIVCTDGYVSHPVCSPCRAGLLTGRYQQRFGHERNPNYWPDDEKSGLPTDQILLPKVLKDAGYVTGGIGKWHEGAHPKFHPIERGFTDWYGFIGGGHRYLPGVPGKAEYNIPLQRNHTDVDEREYLTDAFSREGAAFIKKHQGQPWFLYLAYNAVHTPLDTLPRYLDRLPGIGDPKRRAYAAMTIAMDDGMGRVLDALKAIGQQENTLVFFFSDNGGPINVVKCDNAPLRAGKGTMYEGGSRVPFVVSWPGKLQPGVYREMVSALDVFATACALAKTPGPQDRAMDGVNLLPYLDGTVKAAPHKQLFWRMENGAQYAVRDGDWKLVKSKTTKELFNVAQDIGEQTDLASRHPEIVERLDGEFSNWNRGMIPPVFPPLGAPRAGAVESKSKLEKALE